MEAFGVDGCCYQCYAPEEPLSVKDRYNKHRNKITADLGKFCNGQRVAPLLGTTKIRRWFLVVPINDSKDLVKHANDKTSEILGLDLIYVSDDFRVLAITDEDFQEERTTYLRQGIAERPIPVDDPTPEFLRAFSDTSGPQIKVMDTKLARVPILRSVQERSRYEDLLLKQYVHGIDIIDKLKDDSPELARYVRKGIADMKSPLLMRYGTGAEHTWDNMNAIVDQLTNRIVEVLRGLPKNQAQSISYATMAEWLMECSLNFGFSA
jgi:hypothetical protein